MQIGDFLSAAETTVDVRASTKDRLLKELCTRAAATLKLDSQSIASKILKREELDSTGIGGGVAIPHARIKGLAEPHGVLVRLRQPMDFAAIDGQPVDLVFLLLLPAAPAGEQLNALAAVARCFRDAETLSGLRTAPDAMSLYTAMPGRRDGASRRIPRLAQFKLWKCANGLRRLPYRRKSLRPSRRPRLSLSHRSHRRCLWPSRQMICSRSECRRIGSQTCGKPQRTASSILPATFLPRLRKRCCSTQPLVCCIGHQSRLQLIHLLIRTRYVGSAL